jgi:DNA repair exonuclease SbcCD ATPase subunit
LINQRISLFEKETIKMYEDDQKAREEDMILAKEVEELRNAYLVKDAEIKLAQVKAEGVRNVLKSKIEYNHESILGVKKKIEENEKKITMEELDLNMANIEVSNLEIAVKSLSRKGFRGEILDQVTPFLNARTAYYLDALTDDNISASWVTISENSYGEYTENFHIDITHNVSGVSKFQLLSGGEKRKVRLACALALQDLVATRAVKPISLFIADEIDHAIDDSGLELLMGILERKAIEMGSVFIISHNSLKDWCRNRIVVTKKNNISTIEKITD